MSWVHCNSCYLEPVKENKEFYISSCHHILCSTCKNRTQCPICGNEQNFRVLIIDSSLPPQAKEYFNDLPKMLDSGLNRLQFIRKFQEGQIKSLVSHLKTFQALTNVYVKDNLTPKSPQKNIRPQIPQFDIYKQLQAQSTRPKPDVIERFDPRSHRDHVNVSRTMKGTLTSKSPQKNLRSQIPQFQNIPQLDMYKHQNFRNPNLRPQIPHQMSQSPTRSEIIRDFQNIPKLDIYKQLQAHSTRPKLDVIGRFDPRSHRDHKNVSGTMRGTITKGTVVPRISGFF